MKILSLDLMKRAVNLILFLSFIIMSATAVAQSKKKVDGGLHVNIKLSDPKPEVKVPVKPTRNPDSILYWRADLNFTWDVFWGKPDPKLNFDTYTGWLIDLKPIPDPITGAPQTVTCAFLKYKSWKNPKGKLTQSLLIHEKVHFNIAELFTRKMRKEFTTLDFTNPAAKAQMTAIFDRLNKEMNECQVLYEKETDHSKIEEKQIEWNMKISFALSALSMFASN